MGSAAYLEAAAGKVKRKVSGGMTPEELDDIDFGDKGPDSDGKICSFNLTSTLKCPLINQERIFSIGKVKGLFKDPFKRPTFSI